MEDLKKKLTSNFTNIEINILKENRIIISTQKEAVLAILSYLKNMGYNHLALISCSDWFDDHEFELVYILSSYLKENEHYQENDKITIIIKTRTSRIEAKFITVIDIFENAEPYEREIHEMFGIHFEGHPRLTPLMLERDYEIPPFRKDFDLNNYVADTFGKIPSIEQRKKEENERT